MKQRINPIETEYNNYRFRSRTEARWAVYFDTLNMKYEYELESFDLDGTWYLPDFWLPDLKMWAEVKGQEFNDEERSKAFWLARKTGYPVIQLVGVPECKPYLAYVPYGGIGRYEEREILDHYMYVAKWVDSKGVKLRPAEYPEQPLNLLNAVKMARSARFEYGETPVGKREIRRESAIEKNTEPRLEEIVYKEEVVEVKVVAEPEKYESREFSRNNIIREVMERGLQIAPEAVDHIYFSNNPRKYLENVLDKIQECIMVIGTEDLESLDPNPIA